MPPPSFLSSQAQAQLTQGQIKEDIEKLQQFLREEEEARLAALRKEHEQRRREAEESMARMTQAIKTIEEKIQLIEEELDAEEDGVKILQVTKAKTKSLTKNGKRPLNLKQ